MKKERDDREEQKRGQQEVQTLTNSLLMIDPNKSNGVLPRLYNYTDYNAFSKPTEDIDVSTGSITQSGSAIPSPIVGKYIHLPDGSVSLPALAWPTDTDTGRYLIAAGNPGESVNGTLVYDWNTTRVFYASGYKLRLSSDSDAMPGSVATTTELISGRLLTDSVLSWNLRNTSTGTGAATSIGVINNTGNDLSMIIIGSGNTSLTPGEGQLSLHNGNGFASTSVGLNIINWYSNYIRFCIGSGTSERARFDGSSGAFLIGVTSRIGSESLRVNGSIYCDSTIRGTDITAATGSNTMLQSVSTGKFTITTATPPAVNQFEINAGSSAKSGILLYDVDNTQIHFDLNWSLGGGWVARNASVAWIRKNAARLSFYGSTGNSVGSTATETLMGYFDLATGTLNVSYSDATTNPRVNLLQSSTGDSSLRFAIGTTISYAIGIDNSVSGDPFVLSTAASGSAALGTGNILSITSGGLATWSRSDAVTTPTHDLIQSSTGDAAIRYAIGTTNSFIAGIDNSDSDIWKISYAASGSAALGTNDRLTITVAGLVTVVQYMNVGTTTDAAAQGDFAAGLTQKMFYDESLGFLQLTSTVAKQLRLAYTSGSVYVDLTANSGGDLQIEPTGDEVTYIWTQANQVYQGTQNLSTNSAADSCMYAYVGSTTSGSPMMVFDVGSSTKWTIGCHNSDSRKFKISQAGYAFGTNDRLIIETGGSAAIGTPSLATTATDGFLYVPTCAGVPTGVPTGITGYAPVIVDTTNNRWYFYSGGAWRNAGP